MLFYFNHNLFIMNKEGWIKLHRKLLNSNMWASLTSKQRDVMIACLLLANHDNNSWIFKGEVYKCTSGQFITSLESIAKICGKDVKIQSIRTALLKLEKWHFLTNESTNSGRLITICNWDSYQGNNDTNQQTSKQTANKQLTTNKKYKEYKKDNGVCFDISEKDKKFIDLILNSYEITEQREVRQYIDNSNMILTYMRDNLHTKEERSEYMNQLYAYVNLKKENGEVKHGLSNLITKIWKDKNWWKEWKSL